MPVVVVEPPAPIVLPATIPGRQPADEVAIAAMIQAATEEIDGPGGWLGRALGPQTLELAMSCFYDRGRAEIALPCPPLIEVLSVKYDAADGSEQTVAPAGYGVLGGRAIYPKPGFAWPSVRAGGEARIRYRAGYNGTTTGSVPERARQAIILAVNEMRAVGVENLFLADETVEGVGSRRYVVSSAAGDVIRRTADRLLSGLRVYSP